ncbi:MAG TPA: hypothetical protein VGG18_08730, partial [Granulicella sp.]
MPLLLLLPLFFWFVIPSAASEPAVSRSSFMLTTERISKNSTAELSSSAVLFLPRISGDHRH